MPTPKTEKSLPPLVVRGRNASGKLIEGVIQSGELPMEDPGLAIQKILAKHNGIKPTPVLPQRLPHHPIRLYWWIRVSSVAKYFNRNSLYYFVV